MAIDQLLNDWELLRGGRTMIMQPVLAGGRVKAAAVGMDHLYHTDDVVTLESYLRILRKQPFPEFLNAFFPSDKQRLRKLMKGVGFYRPVLKTDQGMAGNFLPFEIQDREESDLSSKMIIQEEGIALPEPWYSHHPNSTRFVQERFHVFDFESVGEVLARLERRTAGKGRMPFFFIRPALTDQPIILGTSILRYITVAVNILLTEIAETAEDLEMACGGFGYIPKPPNLLYCQPDVFILTDGSIAVEKINCPDVGLFLNGIADPFSTILPKIQTITRRLQEAVYRTIARRVNTDTLTLITRDEVISQKEDVLEQEEIRMLQDGLNAFGIHLKIYTLSAIDEIPSGSHALLLNLDYQRAGADFLLKRHLGGELVCYPNPFFQRACQKACGLPEYSIPLHLNHRFLELMSSWPKENEGLQRVWKQLDRLLVRNDMAGADIFHVDIGEEIIPIFRRSWHSWRQIATRAARYKHIESISIRAIPAKPENLMITSSTGPRLHTFRFMFVAP